MNEFKYIRRPLDTALLDENGNAVSMFVFYEIKNGDTIFYEHHYSLYTDNVGNNIRVILSFRLDNVITTDKVNLKNNDFVFCTTNNILYIPIAKLDGYKKINKKCYEDSYEKIYEKRVYFNLDVTYVNVDTNSPEYGEVGFIYDENAEHITDNIEVYYISENINVHKSRYIELAKKKKLIERNSYISIDMHILEEIDKVFELVERK